MDSNSIRTKASQDTFISLLQLDPAPMDASPEKPDTEKDLPSLPEEGGESGSTATLLPTGAGTAGSVGLSGGNGHGPAFYCA
jgi:hypothetical protein